MDSFIMGYDGDSAEDRLFSRLERGDRSKEVWR